MCISYTFLPNYHLDHEKHSTSTTSLQVLFLIVSEVLTKNPRMKDDKQILKSNHKEHMIFHCSTWAVVHFCNTSFTVPRRELSETNQKLLMPVKKFIL